MSRLFWVLLALVGGGLALLVFNHESGRTMGLDNGDFAQLVSLGGFALLVGAALLTRRMPVPDMLRNLGLWVLLALLLVAAYQFRYELQDVASRVTVGLVPGSPLALTDADGRASLYLERAPNGHFEARAVIAGTPVRLVVDTGASATVLTAEDAARIGLDPADMTYGVMVSTANGMAQAARAEVAELSIGDIVRRNVAVLVAQPGALPQSLLGMNFIGSLSGFDMRGDRLILRD